eukprot:scaffold86513_cov66-Phaeocystis_antarctica.AAC.1
MRGCVSVSTCVEGGRRALTLVSRVCARVPSSLLTMRQSSMKRLEGVTSSRRTAASRTLPVALYSKGGGCSVCCWSSLTHLLQHGEEY